MITHTPERVLLMSQHEENLVLPNDEHNRTLVGNVHPSNWVNPEPAGRYNIVVIGGDCGIDHGRDRREFGGHSGLD
jgi:hypothetical protein